MSLPTTPTKNNHEVQSGLHSILRSTHSRTQSTPTVSVSNKTSPQSQVRFSIPEEKDVILHQESPTKIVYPNSVSTKLNNHGHLVDMQSRVMLDVPEDIWKFHTTRRSHGRKKSLQAIIADTLASINPDQTDVTVTPASRGSTISQVSPLNLRPASKLYLAPESPINSYKIPVPLEISLPPYLSLENQNRKRSSLIFDGDGYSEYHESNSGDNLSVFAEKGSVLKDNMNDFEFSTDSIPSAEHDLSLNTSDHDFDKALGIDRDANVNLKLQHRSLRRPSQSSGSPVTSESLKILATPTKIIQIPDLTCESVSKTPNGSLRFFDHLSSPPTSQTEFSTGQINKDQLDMKFVFPKPSTDTEDFKKVDSSPVSKEFLEQREKRLKQLSAGGKGHGHRRSRSIHQADDIFIATSTPPKVPERSSRRLPLPDSNNENGLLVTNKSPKFIVESSPKSTNQNDAVKEIQTEDSKETSSLYEEGNCEGKNQSGEIPKNYIVNAESDKWMTPSNSPTIKTSRNQNEPDKSIEIIEERIISQNNDSNVEKRLYNYDVNPRHTKHISGIQSFKGENISHESGDITVNFNTSRKEYCNLLSPRRSLSNVGSEASHNSQFSKRTVQSNATSQPQEFLMTENLMNKPLYAKSQNKDEIYFHSIYEEKDGKLVEVLVLDENIDDETIQKTCSKKLIPSMSKRRSARYKTESLNYFDILRMCEDTATDAKETILQLIKEDRNSYKNMKSGSQVSGLANSSENLTQKNYLSGNRVIRADNSKSTEECRPYVSNLNRVIGMKYSQYS